MQPGQRTAADRADGNAHGSGEPAASFDLGGGVRAAARSLPNRKLMQL